MHAQSPLYLTHFGLTGAPFRATPDPRLFYDNAIYREAYATLLYGVIHRKGFIALSGEVGTGKTTLLRRLMDELGPPVRFVLFYNTTLTFDETVEFICGELELPVDGLSRVQRLQRLNDLLITEARRGGNVVLLIDEAQNLGADVLENLRLISNLETASEKLLQIVLVGQPELDVTLSNPALRQVTQRIAVRYRLKPLRSDEIGEFIDHRLRRCGGSRRQLFSADAVARVIAHSNGVPRLVNIVCDAALLGAYGAGLRRVTGAIVDEVATDLKLAPRPRATPHGGLRRPAVTAAVGRSLQWATPGFAALALVAAGVALLPDLRLPAIVDGVRGSIEARLAAASPRFAAAQPIVPPGTPACPP